VVYWYFGDVKLGKDGPEHKPEYSDSSYFMMVFCSGVAVGLFFYGVSEPLYHLNSHRYAAAGYHNDNEKAQYALDLTIYHWGLHGFVVYTLVAILLGYVSFRKGLTLTIRSCFYPLLGDRIYGWVGDVIDSFSIFTVVAGICTSLGLGVMQIVTGLQRLDVLDKNCGTVPTASDGSDAMAVYNSELSDCMTEDDLTNARVVVIWMITAVATASVISGIKYGIKALSQLAFCMAAFLWLMVFVMEDTWYFLNLMVQTTGSYAEQIVALGWRTDAFNQLTASDGGASDGNGGATAWMDWWTIFYWGWWIAWSPFVGMFVAKISKNRTIKEVIHVTLSGPLLFAIIWFSVFGGVGISHQRRATNIQNNPNITVAVLVNGVNGSYDSAVPLNYVSTAPASGCFSVPEISCEDQLTRLKELGHGPQSDGPDGPAISSLITKCSKTGYVFGDPGISPVCNNSPSDNSWFEIMESFYGFGKFLDWITIITIVFYFCTSSDSGSLVVDAIASNGQGFADDASVSIPQRVFWALTEGGVATALLVAGGKNALKALQAVSICAGLPYTVFLCMMCTALWRALCDEKKLKEDGVKAQEDGSGYSVWAGSKRDYQKSDKAFNMDMVGGIFEIFEVIFSAGGTTSVKIGDELTNITNFLIAGLAPVVGVHATLTAINTAEAEGGEVKLFGSVTIYNIATAVALQVLWLLFIIFMFVEFAEDGFWALAWCSFIAFATLLTAVRTHARVAHGIKGNVMEDFWACIFLFPQVIAQMQSGAKKEEAPKAVTDGGK